jgi:hypothetical protein
LREARPEVEIETIEVVRNPGRALSAGVFMIPALVVEDHKWYQAPTLEQLLAVLEDEES